MSEKKGVFRSLKRRYDQARKERRYARALVRGEYPLPPQSVKMLTIKENIPEPRPRVFIETGTYKGDTVAAMKPVFNRVISIEVADEYYRKACKRFERDANVSIRHGDCVSELPAVLAGLKEPAVFWLDGHYSGGATGKGVVEDPVLISIEQIRAHPVKEHVIFIDDARTFDGREGRQDLAEVLGKLKEINARYVLRVQNDIIIASTWQPRVRV
jgi:hypothetical protein